MGVPYAEVIGDPIAHSKSPAIHKFWLKKLGLHKDYRATRVERGGLAAYLADRQGDPDWRGCNLTIPHKEAVLPLLDSVSEEAAQTGAVNLIFPTSAGLAGENSDVVALRDEICDAADEAALLETAAVVIGAGGAARAVLQALRSVPGLEVWILNRSVDKGEALLREFALEGRAAALGSRLPPAALLVNASPLGMVGFPDLNVDLASAGKPFVVDLVYSPAETGLLRRAKVGGMVTTDGLSILMAQARIAFRQLFGRTPPLGQEAELRALLMS